MHLAFLAVKLVLWVTPHYCRGLQTGWHMTQLLLKYSIVVLGRGPASSPDHISKRQATQTQKLIRLLCVKSLSNCFAC